MTNTNTMTTEELGKRVAELEAANAELKHALCAGRLPVEFEQPVKERMAAGLSREQALAVINAQKAWDVDPRHPQHQD